MKINKKVNKKNRSFIFAYLIFLVITALSIYLFFNPVKFNPSQMLTKNEPEFSMVKRVIDGDTIELENGETVRYLGIDTPEIQQKECGSEEASNFNKNLVENKKVRLLRDITDKDSYGRFYAMFSLRMVNL